MSKRKGLSIEDKRKRMLDLFHEKKEFFNLKELEKLAPKEKGIISKSVKDVIQNLVDEGLVDSDKIGTSIYYWAFPSKGLNTLKRKVDDLTLALEEKSKKLKDVKDHLDRERVLRQETEMHNNILEDIEKLKAEESSLLKEIKNFEDSDPEVFEKLNAEIQVAKDAANRWTDNIYTIKSWCKNKFSIESDVLDKHFDIDPDLEYID